MNKNTVKKFIKDRIKEKRVKLQASLNSIAAKLANEFMEKYADYKKAEAAEAFFTQYEAALAEAMGPIFPQSYGNYSTGRRYVTNSYNTIESILRFDLEKAAEKGPLNYNVTNNQGRMSKEAYNDFVSFAKRAHESYGLKLESYDKLETELLGVVAAAPSAKDAIAALTELGIDMTDLKDPPKLPAVVQVTQPVCLFNGDC